MPVLETSLVVLGLWAVLGYLVGSVPFGVLLTKTMGLGDLRKIGSGNIGATNVLRTGNKAAALATLLLDGGKGAVIVLIARALSADDAAGLAGLAAMIGHCYPVWLGFKGGKGVATFLGILLALSFPVGLLCCASWLFAFVLTRISSVGALAAAAASSVWCLVMGRADLVVLAAVLTVLIFWRHRANIARLKAGTEPKSGGKG